jgi:hypothetical protein
VNALCGSRITDQLFKSYVFTPVVLSQPTLQRLLRGEIKKNTRYLYIVEKIYGRYMFQKISDQVSHEKQNH